MLTKQEIIARAIANGHGGKTSLDRRFVDWQEHGLLGQMAEKEKRRGGAGLWPDVQDDLFHVLLFLREHGWGLPRLQDVVLAAWVCGDDEAGSDGIATAQIQLAISDWVRAMFRPDKPTGSRSRRAYAIAATTEMLAHPDAKSVVKRDFRGDLTAINDLGPRAPLPTVLRGDLARLINPNGMKDPLTRAAISDLEGVFDRQIIVSRQLNALGRASAQPLFAWARTEIRQGFASDIARRPILQKGLPFGHLYETMRLGCSAFVTMLGNGLILKPNGDRSVPSGIEPPPAIPLHKHEEER